MKLVCLRGHDLLSQTKTKNLRNCRICAMNKTREMNWKKASILNSDGSQFTTIDYDRAYQVQQGRCANKVCNKHQSELPMRLHTDHDHITGLFRGLLCVNCNHAIGSAKESRKVLCGLIKYLGDKK